MASNDAGTRYQLSAVEGTGVENLRRLGLTTELGLADSEKMAAFRDLAISGHAPQEKGGVPLNIASTDHVIRQMSIVEFLGYVDLIRKLPRLKKMNMHPPHRQWVDEGQTSGQQGDYGLMIDGIRQIARAAARWGIEIVLENNEVDWSRIADHVPADQADWTDSNVSFGTAPEEWVQICVDVGRPNVALCLDTRHACSYAHTIADPERRTEAVVAFVARPELVRHVHWKESYLYDTRGRGICQNSGHD